MLLRRFLPLCLFAASSTFAEELLPRLGRSRRSRHEEANQDETDTSDVSSLPGVHDVLSSSEGTIGRLRTQVTSLNARIKTIANQEQKRVMAAKIEFEKQLSASEREVEHADKQNGELKEENVNLVASSEALQSRARGILEENRNLRASLNSLKDKVQMGANYALKMDHDVTNEKSSVNLFSLRSIYKVREGVLFERGLTVPFRSIRGFCLAESSFFQAESVSGFWFKPFVSLRSWGAMDVPLTRVVPTPCF